MSTGNVASDWPIVRPLSNIHDRKQCICGRTTGRKKSKRVPREKGGLVLLCPQQTPHGVPQEANSGLCVEK
jgi:hypothetical protein